MALTATLPRTTLQQRAERLKARERFTRARKAENEFATQLTRVARTIGDIIRGFAPSGTLEDFFQLRNALQKYGEILRPWAHKVSARMLEEVARRDADAWAELGKSMGRALQKEIAHAPTGETLRTMMNEQVNLITSLPHGAAERVHKLTIEGISNGARAVQVAEEIMRTGQVTKSRAMLIARTETSRTASALTMTRALHVDSPGYFWRTVGDFDVRPIHKKLEGQFIEWDTPPIAGENGERAHAGMIYRCRCYMEPVIPDLI